MSLERGDGYRIVPTTFGTTKDGEVFEHIHLSQRQGRRMDFEAVCQACLGVRPSLGYIRGCSRFFRDGRAKEDRSHGDIMGKPASRAGKGELVVDCDPLHRDAEWMHRPTLLEKCPASKHLPHHT